MNKSYLIVAGAVVIAVAGYFVYASYAKNNITTEQNQSAVLPTTEEQKLQTLNALASSTDTSNTVSDNAKIQTLNNSATGLPKDAAGSPSDAEKIRLLESLQK